ncbi:hypothetical protein [Providencia rettgeri]|uniref:hypothetical protein n=1 Tax=Providencia rettgeri TaxID=587 RepID=UPI001BA6E804|nr:hypothetical protein [Providencia rettgeri]MBS0917693.1 hypothetical protein [Providencia rettgeri]
MKISHLTIALLFVSTQSLAGAFNEAADNALRANDYATYFKELGEYIGSEKQCNEMIENWNIAITFGANNNVNQPDQKDFENAKKLCIDKYKHLDNAWKSSVSIVN